ncbi:MAG: GAP family protein [Methanobacterium sp.]|nr:GAP family protein [Methanobacterium sp.]
MMTLTDKPRLAGVSFYLGAVLILLFTVLIGIWLGNSLSSTGNSNTGVVATIDLIFGAVLLLLGIRSLFEKSDTEGPVVKYMDVGSAASTATKFKHYFIIGVFIFFVNFSTAMLVMSAGMKIGLADAGSYNNIIAVIVITIITMVIIEVPLLLFFILPKATKKAMVGLKGWLSKYGNIITGVFFIILGLILINSGFGQL